MVHISNLAPTLWIFVALFSSGLSFEQQIEKQVRIFSLNPGLAASPTQINMTNLADGNYQFCSQPEPKNWQDGAGVCTNFHKTGIHFDGYYGYPHSDSFICIRGNFQGNAIAGKALSILWADEEENHIPKSAFKWDLEERLLLNQGNIIPSDNHQDGVRWILYDQALLNLEGFYQYNRPRMTPVAQLCKWN